MFQNRHSMAPMRREHDEVRRLVAEYGKLAGELGPGPGDAGPEPCAPSRDLPALRAAQGASRRGGRVPADHRAGASRRISGISSPRRWNTRSRWSRRSRLTVRAASPSRQAGSRQDGNRKDAGTRARSRHRDARPAGSADAACRARRADSDAFVAGDEDADSGGIRRAVPGLGIASTQDAAGIPVHRGWAPTASHHRWLEPFVLMALAGGSSHGYAIVGILTETRDQPGLRRRRPGVPHAPGPRAGRPGRLRRGPPERAPARRDYTITEDGSRALDEWAAVMKERQRLIAEFDAVYLAWVAERRRSREPASLEALRHRVLQAAPEAVLLGLAQAPIEDLEVELLLGQVHLEQRVQPIEQPAAGPCPRRRSTCSRRRAPGSGRAPRSASSGCGAPPASAPSSGALRAPPRACRRAPARSSSMCGTSWPTTNRYSSSKQRRAAPSTRRGRPSRPGSAAGRRAAAAGHGAPRWSSAGRPARRRVRRGRSSSGSRLAGDRNQQRNGAGCAAPMLP